MINDCIKEFAKQAGLEDHIENVDKAQTHQAAIDKVQEIEIALKNADADKILSLINDITIMSCSINSGVNALDSAFFARLSEAIRIKDTIEINKLLKTIRRAVDPMHGLVHADIWIKTPAPHPDVIFEQLIGKGEKFALIASSKKRKSMLLMQQALAASTASPWLGYKCLRPRKCLFCQVEVATPWMHKRMQDMARSMGLRDSGELWFMNKDVMPITLYSILDTARHMRPDIIFIDPIGRFIEGDENKAQDVKKTLSLIDIIINETGAAVFFTHHDGKGDTFGMDATIRGSGSSFLGRDYDAAIALSSHRNGEDVVMEAVKRNYAPEEPQTISWENGMYVVNHDIAPEMSPRGEKKKPAHVDENRLDAIRAIVVENPGILRHSLLKIFATTSAIGEDSARRLISQAEKNGIIKSAVGKDNSKSYTAS